MNQGELIEMNVSLNIIFHEEKSRQEREKDTDLLAYATHLKVREWIIILNR